MTNGACSAPGAPAFSIAFSIAEKWLISHEDESDEDSQQRAAREVLH